MSIDLERHNAELAVRAILFGRYRVRMHYAASGPGVRLYSVWTGDKAMGTLRQLIEPTDHAAACKARDDLIVGELVDLVTEWKGTQ